MGSNQPTMVQTTTIILVLLGLLGQIFASPDEATHQRVKLINAKDEKINGLEGKVEQLEEFMNAKDAKISHQEKKNGELERLIKQLQQQVEGVQKGQRKVFFVANTYVGVSTDINGIITFNHIDANEGEGLNKETGRFRAPV